MKSKAEPPKMNLIADLLTKNERSQRWLARKMGISANTVNSYCVQRSQPPLDRLFQIAEIFGVPVTALINVDYKPGKSPKSLEVSPDRIRVAPNILHIIGLLHLAHIEWVCYSLGMADS